jgi:hypothetical protein
MVGKTVPHRKLLCWVLTYPGTHKTKAKAVADTWGKESVHSQQRQRLSLVCSCDLTLYMTTAPDPDLNTVVLEMSGPESYPMHYEKTRYAARRS